MTLLANPAAPAGRASRARVPRIPAGAFFARSRVRQFWRAVLLLFITFAAALLQKTGAAELPELRLSTTYRSGVDADVYSVAWYTGAPHWTGARRLEFSAGIIRDTNTSRPFAFAGPVWRLTDASRAPFIEFSLGPTGIAGATFDGRRLGGNLHFRSAFTLGTTFGVQQTMRIAFRVEHISNGGLRDDNPGLDSIGLSFVSGWDER